MAELRPLKITQSRGQALTDYVIGVLLVAIVVLGSVKLFGRSISCQFHRITTSAGENPNLPDYCYNYDDRDENIDDLRDDLSDDWPDTPPEPPPPPTTTLPTTTTTLTTTTTVTTSTVTTTSTTSTLPTLPPGSVCATGVPYGKPIPWGEICPRCAGGKAGYCNTIIPAPWTCYCPG